MQTLMASRALRNMYTQKENKLTGNGAADLSPARANTGTVPDHPIFRSLIGFAYSVGLLVDLIIAPFLCYKNKICVVCIK